MDLRSKDSIRQMIWDYLEKNDLADFPRPVHHRIPNFKGSPVACDRLRSMDIFQRAKTIKVNPDKPQQQARFLTLEANKTLLVPTPRLRTGLFNRITPPPRANKSMLKTCSSSQGVRQYSSPVGLDATVKVDLVIIGSVAVSPQGYRVGKGEGYADMEFAMMSSMGAVDQNTVVITTVHDCQVIEDLPGHLFGEHDLCVDIILTPTRTIVCDNQRSKPNGIVWQLLSRDKFSKIPVLKVLREREAKSGRDVRLQGERKDSPLSAPLTHVCTSNTPKSHRAPLNRAHKGLINEDASNSPTLQDFDGRGHLTDVHQTGEGAVYSPDEDMCNTCASAPQRPRNRTHGRQKQDTDRNSSMESSVTKGRERCEVGQSDMQGQSNMHGQRSKGQIPTSKRKKNLSGMFPWAK